MMDRFDGNQGKLAASESLSWLRAARKPGSHEYSFVLFIYVVNVNTN